MRKTIEEGGISVFLIIDSLKENIEELIKVECCICGLEDNGSR